MTYKGMGTTLEAVAIIDDQVLFAHVGDSRIGLVRNGEYHQLTSDHSLVNACSRQDRLRKKRQLIIPNAISSTQSIGQKDELQPDFGMVTVEAEDFIVINSDGLTNMISGDEIRDIVVSDLSVEEKAKTLIRFANNAGGLDNITVVLIRFAEEDMA